MGYWRKLVQLEYIYIYIKQREKKEKKYEMI
jgi:hypothetical protein